MKINLLFVLTILLQTITNFGYSQPFLISIEAIGSPIVSCGGTSTVKLDLYTNNNILISSNTDSYHASLTYSVSSLPITLKISANGYETCPGIGGVASIYLQPFSLSSGNAPATCVRLGSWNGIGDFNLQVNVDVKNLFMPSLQQIGSTCSGLMTLKIDDG